MRFLARKGKDLIQHRLGIAHAPLSEQRHFFEEPFTGLGILQLTDLLQATADIRLGDGREIATLAATEHCRQNPLGLGSRENEFHMGRGLFQRLQQRIEGIPGEHVDLVEDEDPVTPLGRSILNMLNQTANVVDSAIRCPVHFSDVRILAPENPLAGFAFTTRCRFFCVWTLQCRSENSCHRSLAHPSGAAKQIGVSQPVLQNRLSQGIGNRLLPHHFVEIPGAESTGDHLVLNRTAPVSGALWKGFWG